MTPDLDALKKKFREGRRADAIAEAEAACLQFPAHHELKRLCATMQVMVRNFARALELLQDVRAHEPGNADVLFNIGMCHRELRQFGEAAQAFQAVTQKFPRQPDGWASLAECRWQLGEFSDAVAAADRAIALDAACLPAWTVRGNGQQALGQHEPSVHSFTQAIRLAPELAELKVHRGAAWEALGRLNEAAADYQAALQLAPRDDETLKKATMCLLQANRGEEAIALCREVLKAHPDSLTAKLGAEWLKSQLVPLWHVPMMNEEARNRPYHDALQAAVQPDKLVFEIGTGSGLLAMMAARLGAREVVSCEAVRLVADTASRVVAHNGFAQQVRVLAKPSYEVQLGADLPRQADLLVHEIFSSELLGEHVLPAIEDAKARLLAPGAQILPGVASIMVALVGGEALGRELRVDEVSGFDLRAFNAIQPAKRPLHREDLPRELLSEPAEAFRFDFQGASHFPPEKKRLELRAGRAGRCWGVIQWIRLDFGGGTVFENHPEHQRPVANWQHTVYLFEEPVELQPGALLAVQAQHDRSRPWFERVA